MWLGPVLANRERAEARRDQHRSARKDASVQFIGQAIRTADAVALMVYASSGVADGGEEEAIKRARASLGEVWPLAALVHVEGSAEVAALVDDVTKALQAEAAKAYEAVLEPEKVPAFRDASQERSTAQGRFTAAARDLIATEEAPSLPPPRRSRPPVGLRSALDSGE